MAHSTLKFLFLLLLITVYLGLYSCSFFRSGDSKPKHIAKEDSVITEEMEYPDIYNPNWMINIKEFNRQNNTFKIFRVDASNPDRIKVYAHILDDNGSFLLNAFDIEDGYYICGIRDNNIKKEVGEVLEFQAEDKIPFDVSFVMDHSGSIGDYRAEEIQSAVFSVIDLKRSEDAFSIIKFDSRVNEVLSLTDDKNLLKSKMPIIGLSGYGGSTALNDGIIEGIESLKNSDNERKGLIVFTDGYDNSSNNNIDDVIEMALDNDVSIFTIGFGAYIDESTLKFISQRTGGAFYRLYKTEEFDDVFLDIYNRLKNYYMITYSDYNKGIHYLEIDICKKKDSTQRTSTIVYFNGDKIIDCPYVDLDIKGMDIEGNLTDSVNFIFEEIVEESYHPLLPYIFFEKNEDSIKLTDDTNKFAYIQQREQAFRGIIEERNIVTSPSQMEVYHNLLNIIGTRWQNDKSITFTLYGYNDGKSETIQISQQRAAAVKDYLVNTCGVNPANISISAGGRPPHNPGINNKDRVAENRRVEIIPSDPTIMYPYRYVDSVAIANPPAVRNIFYIDEPDRFESLEYMLKQGDDYVIDTKSRINLKKYDFVFPHDILKDILYSNNNTFCGVLKLNTNDGQECYSNPVCFNINLRTHRKNLGKYKDVFGLILFTMNSSNLTEIHKDIIDTYILPKLDSNPEANILIEGYTDRIGGPGINDYLSCERSKSVAEYIVNKTNERFEIGNNITVECHGESKVEKFPDNDFPQGRMYSRIVYITLEYSNPNRER